MQKLVIVMLVLALGLALAQAPQVQVLERTAQYRLVRHAGGETRVPASPKRVVTLLYHLTDGLLALGLKPVGTVAFEDRGFLPYLAPYLDGTTSVGNIPTPSLEAILAAQPDLILGDPFHADIYNQLSRIAPTVLIPDRRFNARQTLADLGAILGMEDEARARTAQFDGVMGAARAKLAKTLGDASAAYLSARPEGFYLYGSDSGPAKILYNELGLKPDPLLGAGRDSVMLSLEELPQLSAEIIFLSEDDPERARELKESPLFRNIPAVRKGQVYTVDRDLWLLGHSSPIGAELIAKDVLRFLTGNSEE